MEAIIHSISQKHDSKPFTERFRHAANSERYQKISTDQHPPLSCNSRNPVRETFDDFPVTPDLYEMEINSNAG